MKKMASLIYNGTLETLYDQKYDNVVLLTKKRVYFFLQLSREITQLKIKKKILIHAHILSDKTFKGYLCKSAILQLHSH